MARTRDGQEEFANPQPSSSQCILPLFPRPSWRQSVDFCGAKTASGRSVSDVTPADTHAVSLFARGSENRPEIVGRKSAAQSSKWASVTVVANHFLGQALSTAIYPLSKFSSQTCSQTLGLSYSCERVGWAYSSYMSNLPLFVHQVFCYRHVDRISWCIFLNIL